ncbi:hypothetical protein PR202_gb02678 [Eleusine coracana subsp. coracana]|uniref:Uncharacterized protein n=1 Tax=Eleusine coracana subsp. coracana TaxID=191504 RepID=A0AAV5DZA9_ELECO|nr:hypothetical protein PR202_gb02678 [Eleusine coracana subsp. coracana]
MKLPLIDNCPGCSSFPNTYGKQTYDFNTSKARALGLEFKGVEEMLDDAVDSLRGHGHLLKSKIMPHTLI